MAQFPTKFLRAQTCTITSKTLTEITEYGMVTMVGKRGNPHKWAIEFMTPALWNNDARELQAFLDSLDGRYNTFTLPCPLHWMTDLASVDLTSSHVVGQETINIEFGVPVSVGDYIKFSNHDKCYKIVGYNAGGNTMDIYPRLQQPLSISDTFGEAVFTCRMTKDDLALALDARTGMTPVLVTAIEA